MLAGKRKLKDAIKNRRRKTKEEKE